jgi:hypothetical protein
MRHTVLVHGGRNLKDALIGGVSKGTVEGRRGGRGRGRSKSRGRAASRLGLGGGWQWLEAAHPRVDHAHRLRRTASVSRTQARPYLC